MVGGPSVAPARADPSPGGDPADVRSGGSPAANGANPVAPQPTGNCGQWRRLRLNRDDRSGSSPLGGRSTAVTRSGEPASGEAEWRREPAPGTFQGRRTKPDRPWPPAQGGRKAERTEPIEPERTELHLVDGDAGHARSMTTAVPTAACRHHIRIAGPGTPATCWPPPIPSPTTKALSGLARQGPTQVLEPLPYRSNLDFHDPTCVVVDPARPTPTRSSCSPNAAAPTSRGCSAGFRDPVVAERLGAVYQLVFNEGANVAVVTNHGQIIDIALVGGAADRRHAGRTHLRVLGEQIEVDDLAERFNVPGQPHGHHPHGVQRARPCRCCRSAPGRSCRCPRPTARRRSKLEPPPWPGPTTS